ncbi:MAG TPA: hypothetical protein VFZ61_27440 [Polyangiales bacterium]
MSSTSQWLLTLTTLMGAACGDEVACTLDIRSPLSGELRDGAGNAVTPDSVEREGPGSRSVRCDVRPGGYTCTEAGAGRARVTVRVGDDSWTQPIRIRATDDGCHDAQQQLDFSLPELTPCVPSNSVTGALVHGSTPILAGATVQIRRESEWDRDPSTPSSPSVACVVEMGRYRCPAINTYSDTDYRVTLEFGGQESSALVHVQARNCQVETVEHDIELTSLGVGG